MIYLTAVILGFFGNFHCLGMCGPIALSLPIGKLSPWRKLIAVLAYNLGRIVTYGVFGTIIGLFGAGLNFVSTLQMMSILAGILLVLIGLIRVFRKTNIKVFPKLKLIDLLKKQLGNQLHKRSLDSFLLLGFFNGMLPCGLVYAAAISSIVVGSVQGSALYMMLFGVGTFPVMILLPYIGQFITLKFRNIIKQVVPFVLIIFGVLFILRGSNLGIRYISPKIESSEVQAGSNNVTSNTINCH